MKPKLSIILPGIRQNRWDSVYESILGATKQTFELIIVGPLPLTERLQSLPNVKYAKDLGSPLRASNIAGMMAEGELVTWIADDAILLPNSLDDNIKILEEMGGHYKDVVMIKYLEGKNGTIKGLPKDEYFYINNSGNSSPYLDNNWLIFNHVIMYRQFFDELGGWDCEFEACPMGHNDFAIRAQQIGANVKISQIPCLDCDHMEGGTGDHMPIYLVQTFKDQPKYQNRYRNPNWVNQQMRIDINNWKLAPSVWNIRFKKGVPMSYSKILEENNLSSL
jgi:GT2 family glycosyltransferase